ncbi:DUF3237 family protein [Bacillus subtilis]|uniref:DUF3237 family protein n=2 Tax=Bacillus subtilis TaxID=1423 RepID=A0A0D1KRB9_BACIU|nr:hypothetical protein SC09_contig4orf00613 [Bacillus subtilis]MEC0313909.1 DUF3237 family protein [Bacillus subtilis]MEC0360817.1 DUF3237 family protein [Bacillus subtilis]WEY85837.1 DUF3237 family protein [Bacillus subtilis]WEY99898.1 DUF3237 family protein [Bacillus subtilis]
MKKPVLKPFASLEIKVDPPITIGETSLGLRRFIPIRSGTITGEVKGRILPGGADSQMIRSNGRTDLSARYVIETADHELIYIENNGIRQVSEPFRKQAAAGEIIEPEHVLPESRGGFTIRNTLKIGTDTNPFVQNVK